MSNRFFIKEAFDKGFGKEMVSASQVYERRKEGGMVDYSLAVYDFVFIADTQTKLNALAAFLIENYGYSIRKIIQQDAIWELQGDATEFPVDENNLMYWALDLYCKGFEFDCKLDGYGAVGDPTSQNFPDTSDGLDSHYFELAMDAFNRRNFGMAIINFSTAININPNDPNIWYSRAFVKDELYTWKAARRDYDKAIELAPDFADAIVNRAANKDEAGEYQEAIADYTKALEFEPENSMAYFNRGNSKFNLKDIKGACEDWNQAKTFGAAYAQERIDEHCLAKTFQQKLKGIFSR